MNGLTTRLNEAYRDLEKIANVLEKEHKDFEKLQKLSLKGLFYQVLGSKEEQIEMEKQEYLQASLHYDEVKKEVDLMEYEYKVLDEKIKKLQGIDAKAKYLMQKREEELIHGNTEAGQKLLTILREMDHRQLRGKEVKEALELGHKVVRVLDEIIAYLQKARNWGNWDVMGSKQYSSYAKHSNIDSARERIATAQNLLHQFGRELEDVYEDVNKLKFQLNIGSFARFADIFFDNLISDWVVQKRILNAIGSVKAVHDRVVRMIHSLQAQSETIQKELGQLEEQRSTIILQ